MTGKCGIPLVSLTVDTENTSSASSLGQLSLLFQPSCQAAFRLGCLFGLLLFVYASSSRFRRPKPVGDLHHS